MTPGNHSILYVYLTEGETINWIQKIALIGSAIAGFIILISIIPESDPCKGPKDYSRFCITYGH